MIQFLLKGLIRDKSRSRLPVLVVAIGVMLSVFLHAYITGLMVDMVEQTARFTDGHVKVMTRAYAQNANQLPNDLAILNVSDLYMSLKTTFPLMDWSTRIRFGGLLDVAGTNGETLNQGPAIGFGIDLLSPGSAEIGRLNLRNSLVRGQLPKQPGEILLSEDFSHKLSLNPGEQVTFIGSTMYGGMAFYNFTVAGTIHLGSTALDRGMIIADITDVQNALDMNNAAGEIIGFFEEGYYDDRFAESVITKFNQTYPATDDEFEPIIKSLRDQGSMSLYIDLSKSMGAIITMVFILAMSLVLWNAGLLGGLRRYGEIGLRLAIGEEKRHVYQSMIYESVMIGIAGTLIGTAIGLGFAWLLQVYGLNIGEFTKNASASVMIPDIIRARITPVDYYIGFIPGLISTVLGTALSGIGIFRRKTAQLFKELEV